MLTRRDGRNDCELAHTSDHHQRLEWARFASQPEITRIKASGVDLA
jgi:hypothetical protein